MENWNLLLSRLTQNVKNIEDFLDLAVKLSFGVAKDNFTKLTKNLNGVEMGGLEPTILLSRGARIMLTRNIWTKAGLCNGAMGTVRQIFAENHTTPMQPVAVVVQFDESDYKGPGFSKDIPNCVPVYPVTSYSDSGLARKQLPLKLAWSITIHKSQGLTLKK